MEKVKPSISDCCYDLIRRDSSRKKDVCCGCGKDIAYALVGAGFHRRLNETNAVCQLHDGSLWFFWQQVSDWDQVLESEQEYLGQLKSVVASHPCGEDDEDPDMIPYEVHLRFSNYWKKRVRNPEMALPLGAPN